MDTIDRCTQELISSIKNGEAYQNYVKCEKALERYPGLDVKLDRLRGDIYRMYNENEADDLLESADELEKSYREMHKIPEVNAYLDAESELCKQIREVCRSIINEVGISPPEL